MNIQQPEKVSRECLESVRSATVDLLAEREQFDVFINKMLDEMETVRVDVSERERQLADERIKVESHIHEVEGLKEKIEERERAIFADESRTKQELDETQAKLWEQENQYKELAEAAHTAETRLQESSDRVRSFEEERDSLREKLDAATHELSQFAGVLEMFESTQSELAETQNQLVQARDEMDQVKLRSDSKTDDRVRKLEGEKRSCESDLEQARTQMERLTKKVEDQKQQLRDHRARWTVEIKQQRSSGFRRPGGCRDRSERAPSWILTFCVIGFLMAPITPYRSANSVRPAGGPSPVARGHVERTIDGKRYR